MSMEQPRYSTGLPGLDQVLQNLHPGDNVVWQVDHVETYRTFVEPFYKNALATKIPLTYFHFASRPLLIPETEGIQIHTIHPEEGFEAFITRVHEIIDHHEPGECYVFDSLSELARDCYSDRMVGNFFMLTCPYLFSLGSLAYFAVLRDYHSTHAAGTISETTQILLDVYSYKNKLYIHPQKVWNRYSPTLHMLHVWEGDRFLSITNSSTISEVLTSVPRSGLESALYQIGVWNRVFVEADEVLKANQRGEGSLHKIDQIFHQLLRMAITREERFTKLAEEYLTLQDLMKIRERMIGTGFIGGKTVGMLLARAILNRHDAKWHDILEAHDSYYIGSEVFYTYLVLNDCWWVRKRQKNPEHFLEQIDEARDRIMQGEFPHYLMERFKALMEYFGQSPIVVRSSSLLEDNFGNLFAGKYESIFCTNQGTFEERLADFLLTIRKIYASSMSEKALSYRASRGLLEVDEQMALLVQRVSGNFYGNLFFPQIAGVGYSYNPYVWNTAIDSKAGVLRLVFGLGTRAVDRYDDDYTRLVALNEPNIRPENTPDEIKRYTQRKVDVLDLTTNQKKIEIFSELLDQCPDLPLEWFISQDDVMRCITQSDRDPTPVTLSFKTLFSKTSLLSDLREMLHILEEVYQHPVDIEFTVNFIDKEHYKINLLQCRPFHSRGSGIVQNEMPEIDPEKLILQASGAVIGSSTAETVNRLIYVVPSVYGQLPLNDRYSLARLIGKLTRLREDHPPKTTLLLGPGRWGTTTPSLGVPVSFAEIGKVSILGEIVSMRDDLIPDVSLGTHFFSDLVEMDILYFALFPERAENFVQDPLLTGMPNRLCELIPEASRYTDAVRVLDFPNSACGERFVFNANTLKQSVFGYLTK